MMCYGSPGPSKPLRQLIMGASAAAGKGALTELNALEDTSAAMLWQWELRDAKVLPRALQPGAMSRKRALHKARAPLGCTQCGVGRLAGDMEAGPACRMRRWKAEATARVTLTVLRCYQAEALLRQAAIRLTALATASTALPFAGKSRAADARLHRALEKLAAAERPWPAAPGAAAGAAAGVPGPAGLAVDPGTAARPAVDGAAVRGPTAGAAAARAPQQGGDAPAMAGPAEPRAGGDGRLAAPGPAEAPAAGDTRPGRLGACAAAPAAERPAAGARGQGAGGACALDTSLPPAGGPGPGTAATGALMPGCGGADAHASLVGPMHLPGLHKDAEHALTLNMVRVGPMLERIASSWQVAGAVGLDTMSGSPRPVCLFAPHFYSGQHARARQYLLSMMTMPCMSLGCSSPACVTLHAQEGGAGSRDGSPAAKRARGAAASGDPAAAAAERERKRLEREAEKEAKRAEKDAARRAREAAKAAEEAEKKAHKSGFRSVEALGKSRNFMDRFVKKRPAAATPEPARGPASASASPGSATRPPRKLEYHELFSPPPAHLRLAPGEARTRELDAALAAPLAAGAAQAAARATLDGWRGRPARRRARGLPPTWARRPGADAGALAARLEREYGGGAALAALPVWRRKFLWFPADGSARPPYYGSWSRGSAAVTGRRPLARDALMDYELMSDQEWEEEPEGEDLSVRNALPSP